MSDQRLRDLQKIHIAKKDLGMDNDTYRRMLQSVARVDSAAEMDVHGRAKVLAHLRKLGWRPKRLSPKGRGRMSDKARALWITLHKSGAVRDGSETALNRYVAGVSGLSAVNFIDNDPGAAYRVIESLKKWLARSEQAAQKLER